MARFVWIPLARFWPAVLYVALFSRSLGSALLFVVALWCFHYLDAGVEIGFAPVWDRLRTLPARHSAALLAARALVGVSAPFVLSYSLAWFNPLYDRSSFLYGLGTMVACFFISRGPSPRPAAQPLALSGPGSPSRPLPGLAVLTIALGAGLLLALGIEGVALA